ncbi:pyridoxamine 5'-phosphate oxidase family protein [Ferrovibrio sp.]|uniref:pyridoxamine 5'-phosphate oxidase family protein n=1 Tax=Ferrovibrio sp. TaxID=1917215 RepID=UPI000CB03A40|nr:pyridoxamine 5'-phosphate oxidase family protein [Ferrovibrio sp.]PJI43785.1 MAG: flavin-nucleotide-binding protein [Ferrovibrio sp.]
MGRFHEGEQQLQARVHPALPKRMARTAEIALRDFMPDQHRDFFALLPTLVVGSVDDAGRPWASMLAGKPGFVTSPDPVTLQVSAKPAPGDMLAQNLKQNAQLGILGLQPETRRRNRMNGRVTHLQDDGFTVHVEQSFGNCPQYIQARLPRLVGAPAEPPVKPEDSVLSPRAALMLAETDTLFIATHAKDEGVDVSHRGGKPGFVRVEQRAGFTQLTLPDFRGNNFFNTLGNIALDSRAGLLVVNYDSGDLLQITGQAEIVWDGPEVERFQGALRLLRLRVEEGRILQGALPIRWSQPAYAMQLLETGSW